MATYLTSKLEVWLHFLCLL